MSLGVLVIMVVAGVSLVVAVVAWSGVSRSATLASEDEARALLLEEFPDARLGEGLMTGDGRAAFFRCGNGRIALAAALGDRYVLRLYDRPAIRRIAVKEDGSARIRFDDFTLPSLRLRFASAADARNLTAWLDGNTLEETHA